MAHHGKPLGEFHEAATSLNWGRHNDHWWPKADGEPAAAVMPLIEAVRERWPQAWEAGAPLPIAPRFVALFAGLVAWQNHRNERNGGAAVDAQAAGQVALDFARRFTEWLPFDGGEAVATRLGARDLLIDLAQPLAGAFGGTVDRIAIPAWMAPGVGDAAVEARDVHGFSIGSYRFAYDQWGLRKAD